MSDTEFFFDSNLLVYAFDQSEGEKQKKARELLDQHVQGKLSLYFSTQTFEEFFVNATKKIPKPLTPLQAHEILEAITNYKPENVLIIQPKYVLTAIITHQTANVSFWDCLIAETAKQNGVHAILTEDTRDFSKISGIKARNPFKRKD